MSVRRARAGFCSLLLLEQGVIAADRRHPLSDVSRSSSVGLGPTLGTGSSESAESFVKAGQPHTPSLKPSPPGGWRRRLRNLTPPSIPRGIMLSSRSAAVAASLTLCARLALVAPPVSAQEVRSDTLLTVDHYLDFEQVSDPRISPDGKQVIYTRRWVNVLEDKWESALWLMNSDGSHNRFLVKGASAVWSPDGNRIAYLADGEPKGTQIFVRWMDTEGASTQITRLLESPADIKWSPDGKSLGFSQFVAKKSPWEISLPAPPAGAKWTEAPRIVQQLHFRQDRRGFTDPGYRHMFVVSADGGTPQQITSGDWSVGARFDVLDGPVGWSWTPDGRSMVVEGMNDSTADLNYRNSNIYLIDLATRGVRRLTEQNGVWTSPTISPDGRRIAFTGYPATKASYQASEIYLMNLDGSGAHKITSLDRDPDNLEWVGDGSGLYFQVDDHGTNNIGFVPLPARCVF